MKIEDLLERIVEKEASDGFISAGAPPSIKVDGTLYPVRETPLTPEEAQAVAEDLNVDVKEVHRMEGRLSSRDVAFDLPSDSDDEDNAWQSPQYYLEDQSQDPATTVEEDDWQRDSESRLHNALADLDERSRDILAQRWLAEEKATLHELAAKYEVSAERIRQLEQNAMKNLRSAIAA